MNNVGSIAIADFSPDGIVLINNKSKVEHVNPAFIDITGCLPGDLIGLDENALNTGYVICVIQMTMARCLI